MINQLPAPSGPCPRTDSSNAPIRNPIQHCRGRQGLLHICKRCGAHPFRAGGDEPHAFVSPVLIFHSGRRDEEWRVYLYRNSLSQNGYGIETASTRDSSSSSNQRTRNLIKIPAKSGKEEFRVKYLLSHCVPYSSIYTKTPYTRNNESLSFCSRIQDLVNQHLSIIKRGLLRIKPV
jgi:hypothetical protein